MTYLNGYLVMPNFPSSSEDVLLTDGAGAVAAFASTDMTNAQPQNVLDHGFMEAIFLALLVFTSTLPGPTA